MALSIGYKQAISYVKSLDVYGSVLGLDNMKALADELENPESGLKFIHVTGTNGKGSVSAYISNILIKAGYKVGTYNSPAVISDIDQFRINMKMIKKKLYAEAIELVKDACERLAIDKGIHPTRFEVETMAAFVAFYIEKCDIVVLETGLGGKDDATNIVTNTLLHVFTHISMDHAAVLGDSLQKIAENKSGIIKSSSPTVICARECSTEESRASLNVILNKCEQFDSNAYIVSDENISKVRIKKNKLIFDYTGENNALKKLKLKMRGAYQPLNAVTAIKAIEVLNDVGYNISEESIKKGLKKTEIPFRFERIEYNDKVDIILDGAHNPDGAKQFVKSLELNYPDRDFIFITGIFKDKEYDKISSVFAGMALKIYAIQNEKSVRSLDKDVLADTLRKYNKNVFVSDTICSAVSQAIDDAKVTISANATHPIVCCIGSLSWLNEAKTEILKLKEKDK